MIGLVLVGGLAGVSASSGPVELQWSAPEGCPQRDEVYAAIERALPPAAGDERPLRASGHTMPTAEGFVLTLQVGDAAATREISASTCTELAATAALIIAIAVDPRAVDAPTWTPDAAPPDAGAGSASGVGDTATDATIEAPDVPAAPAAFDDERPSPAAPKQPQRRRAALVGRVHAGLAVGLSPAPTGVVAASLAVVTRAARVELDLAYWMPRRVTSTRNASVGLAAQLWTVGARACGTPGRGRVSAPLCGVAQAGQIHGVGRGALDPRRAAVPWVGVGGGAMLLVRVARRVSVSCAVDGIASVVRGGFRTEPSGDVDRVGPLAITATCGMQWHGVLESSRSGQLER